jgi:hypothetical protein
VDLISAHLDRWRAVGKAGDSGVSAPQPGDGARDAPVVLQVRQVVG